MEVLVLATLTDGEIWDSTEGISGTEYIGVDKNHDLSYYVNGSDWVDSDEYNVSPGTFGYEWGGYGIETGITSTDIGTGLANTNALIGMNLQPDTSGWWVVWDKVEEFRQSHSDNWFVPSIDELDLVYKNKANLSNLSLNTRYYYWSSSERSYTNGQTQYFNSGYQTSNGKDTHDDRARLCVQFTQADID